MASDLKETLTLFFERANSSQTLWNLDIAVTLGLLAFLATVKPRSRAIKISYLLAAGYIIFALSNLGALLRTFDQQRVLGAAVEAVLRSDPANNLSALAKNCTDDANFIAQLIPLGKPCAVNVASENGLITFYVVFALLTLFVIITIPRTLSKDDANCT